ncbi:MAG TPA: RES family NAD+ phosphorylase [Actinomycetota bacterium]
MPDLPLIEAVDSFPRAGYQGQAFRHLGPRYSPLNAEGARIHGGRWNPPESFPTLYLGLDRETVVGEFYRLARHQSMPPAALLPRRLYTYRTELTGVLDLTTVEALSRVGLSLDDIRSEDPSACQGVGEAAHYVGFEAVRASSATGSGEVVAVFYDRLTGDAVVEPVGFEEWTTLPSAHSRDRPPPDLD